MGLLNDEHTMATALVNFFQRGLSRLNSSESSGRSSSRTIEAGEFSIDTGCRTVTIQTHEVSLTEAELDLLVFLCRHRRKVVLPARC
jgi:DNA-binding response OmpR family regulator